MNMELWVSCSNCGGVGQTLDDYGFTDQCYRCSSRGVEPATPAEVLAAAATLDGAETYWLCVVYGMADDEEREECFDYKWCTYLVGCPEHDNENTDE